MVLRWSMQTKSTRKTTIGYALAATALMFGVGAMAAAPSVIADPNSQCTVPESLDEVTFLFDDDATKTPENPYAGTQWQMTFHPDGTYEYTILNDGSQHAGTYTYQTTSPIAGVISASEVFNGTPAQYTQTLTCATSTTGTYLYSQTTGTEPAQRSNTAKYTILSGPAS
ncbi:hypothetical protein MHAE_14470 [Mycobacterium haemophilum DSM 44634]